MKRQQFFDDHAHKWDSFVSKEKRDRLESTIIPRLGVKKGQAVLDVGAGTGILVPYLLEMLGNGKITVLDYSAKMLVQARKKFGKEINYICSSADKVPARKNIYDVAVCYSVFPHFNEPQKTLNELFRVIKTKGHIVIVHSESRNDINKFHESIGGAVGHDILPPNKIMKKLLSVAGFKKIKIQSTSRYYIVTGSKL